MRRQQRQARARKPGATFAGKSGLRRYSMDSTMYERGWIQWMQAWFTHFLENAGEEEAKRLFFAHIRKTGPRAFAATYSSFYREAVKL